ncbi:hypothetical protein [Photobacterium minamisatsumaniensis]|uniref:hypothetical protein n=1 Tax=Photobacterium minamisatsumaniensis TaxID=2910233 RepID=UPI003D145236
MKKVILLGLAIFALSGCDSDDIDPVLNEQYCASVKLSDNQYKIDKIKSDYYREYLPLGEEYCENYNKYVFNKTITNNSESTLSYDAPFLVSDFDGVFYTIGLSSESGTEKDISALIVSSDLDLDNLDGRVKLLINNPIPFFGNYFYYDKSLAQIIELAQDIDWENIDFNEVNWIKILLDILPDQTFKTIDEAVAFDEHFSTSLNAHELSVLYSEIAF